MSDSAHVEPYFDPEDDLESRVAEEIGRAKRSVWIQAYKFASESIVETILRLKRANPELDVRLALDAREALSRQDKKQGRLVDAIAEAGGEVRFVSDADKSHSKFIIVDGEVVLTGSFNFKRHADRVQRDNLVVIRSDEVAQTYATRFQATLTSDRALDAKGRAGARRSRTIDESEPDLSAGIAMGHPPEVESEAGDAPAAPAAQTGGGVGLLEAPRRLAFGFAGRSVGPVLAGLKVPLSLGTAVLVLLLGSIGIGRFGEAPEPDAELEFSGFVEAMPPDGLVGTWQIGGRAVQVTETTEIERTSSSPMIGTLVAVEATILADNTISALEIELGDEKD